MTGAEGEFAFEGLDPELTFQLLVYAPGFVPTYTERGIDPRMGALELTLEPHDLAERPPERVLRGKIVDAHGDPVARAVVSPNGRKLGNGVQFGGLEGTDELALTDARGEFSLGVSAPGEELLVQVKARGFAERMSPWIAAGAQPHVLAVGRGVTVTGVLRKGERPLAGVELGLVQVDRSSERFVGERTIGTGPDGRFTFVNVPPAETWALYGHMNSLVEHGALSVRQVQTAADETTLDVGTIPLELGARLRGRVELADGAALPADTRILISREDAWDTQVMPVGADGRFAFAGLPRELFSLNVRVPGYRLSPRNASYDLVNEMGLIGRVEGDQELLVLLEPGSRELQPVAPSEEEWKRYQALLLAPLRGAEPEAK